nr:hypothetical protein [Tanacetum cinerariifolium]
MENIAVVMVVVENITVEYFLDSRNFGSRLVVGVDDTQVVVDKLDRVSFTFQTKDTVARENLSFLTMERRAGPRHHTVCSKCYTVCNGRLRETIDLHRERVPSPGYVSDNTSGKKEEERMYLAIRQLAYDAIHDALDEYLQMGAKTSCDSLSKLFGSIDCVDWEWSNCPTAYRTQFFRGDRGSNPFILLEAIASQDWWVYHTPFCVFSANNNVKVLHQSPLFNDLKDGKAPEFPVGANDPGSNTKQIRYKNVHEAARKDVERAFAILKKKLVTIKILARPMALKNITDMMYTCIILHNMIGKDNKRAISPEFYPDEQHREDDPNHISHPHCEELKRAAEPGKSSMSRDGSIFVYDPDVLHEQFAGLVIQRGLPFNHFDDEQTTRVFQKHLQQKYNHIFFMTTKLSEYKLEGGIFATMVKPMKEKLKKHFERIPLIITCAAALNPCFNVHGVEFLIESISTDLEFFDDSYASKVKNGSTTLWKILDAEVQENEVIPLSDEEIALDAASSGGSTSGPGSEGEEAADYGYDIFPTHAGGLSRSSREPKYDIEFHTEDSLFIQDDDQESVVMPKKNGDKFLCYLPKVKNSKSEKPTVHENTTNLIFETEKRIKLKTPDELLEAFKDQCFLRQEGWWSYKFCYHKKLLQAHLEEDKVVQEFVLGEYDAEATAAYNRNVSDISTLKDPRSKDASQRYHAHIYKNGTTCDLTNEPRETEVRFVCSEPRAMISSITELSTCKYALTIQCPTLCKHPLFQEERPVSYIINCNPLPKDYKQPKMEDDVVQEHKIDMVTDKKISAPSHSAQPDSVEYAT